MLNLSPPPFSNHCICLLSLLTRAPPGSFLAAVRWVLSASLVRRQQRDNHFGASYMREMDGEGAAKVGARFFNIQKRLISFLWVFRGSFVFGNLLRTSLGIVTLSSQNPGTATFDDTHLPLVHSSPPYLSIFVQSSYSPCFKQIVGPCWLLLQHTT